MNDLFPNSEPSFRSKLQSAVQRLAASNIFIGTSSWKYPGWCGQIYDEQRYHYRGKFAETRFERDCLNEYAETFKTVCVDAAYYQFPSEPFHAEIRSHASDLASPATAAVLLPKRLRQHPVEPEFLGVAELLKAEGHAVMARFRLGAVSPEQPVPPWQVEAEVAVRLAA